MSENVSVHSVPTLDLEKYLGRWYEIGRLPLRWEDPTATNITAEYRMLDDGSIEVDNRCFDKDHQPTQSIGRANPVEGTQSQLKVSFLPPFLRWIPFTEGDYWVLKIDENYEIALVGTPDRKNLWLLARDWRIDQKTVADYLKEARAQGFELAEWITTAHDGTYVSNSLLEK